MPPYERWLFCAKGDVVFLRVLFGVSADGGIQKNGASTSWLPARELLIQFLILYHNGF